MSRQCLRPYHTPGRQVQQLLPETVVDSRPHDEPLNADCCQTLLHMPAEEQGAEKEEMRHDISAGINLKSDMTVHHHRQSVYMIAVQWKHDHCTMEARTYQSTISSVEPF